MRAKLLYTSLVGLIAVAIASLVHPFGAAKQRTGSSPLETKLDTTPAVLRILERSCQNCHSDRTEWPWYSYVAPMSWIVEYDVQQGRAHLNLSRWSKYSPSEQPELLGRIATVVRSRRMPLPRYVRVHPEAKLSETEVELLYHWARSERGIVGRNPAPRHFFRPGNIWRRSAVLSEVVKNDRVS